MKPRLFIASSVEGLGIANAIHQNLDYEVECTVWSHGVFTPSAYPLEDIVEELEKSDFGAFVFSPDDIVKMREEEHKAIRDNVIFELGLFIGHLGRKRTFMAQPRDGELHIPSDLIGLKPVSFSLNRSDDNVVAALGPACQEIRTAIKKFGPVLLTVDEATKQLDEKCIAVMIFYGGVQFFASPNPTDFDLAVFDQGVKKLRELKLLRFELSGDGNQYAYHWEELAKVIIEKYGYDKAATGKAATARVVAENNSIDLSDDECALLVASSGTGQILRFIQTVQANGVVFTEKGNARSFARWKGVVDTLESKGLLETRGHKNEVFAVTEKGFQAVDKIMDQHRVFSLSDEAKQLLKAAKEDSHGLIYYSQFDGGIAIQCNNENFVPKSNPRAEADWKDALKELTEREFINCEQSDGSLYQLSKQGYAAADRLQHTFPLKTK